jgi:hypothetical protein
VLLPRRLVPVPGCRTFRLSELREVAALGDLLKLLKLFLAALLDEARSRDPMFFAVFPELLPGLQSWFAAF